MNRKSIEIGELLGWAYRQELPKSREGKFVPMMAEMNPLASYSDLGTVIDSSPNAYGCVVDPMATEEADPDAIRVGRAVADLDWLDFLGLVGVDMLGDVAEDAITGEERVKAHEDGARMAFGDTDMPRRAASISVAMVAKLGQRPSADPVGTIKRSFVTLGGKPRWFRMEWRQGTAGRSVPIEVDGYNRKSGRPHKDAYRKFLIAPELGPFVAERIDYQIWRQSLDHLVAVLNDTLERFEVRGSTAPRWPWEGRERIVPVRVWPILRDGPHEAA